MTKKSKGSRVRTRYKLSQRITVRPTITKFFQEFNEGQTVVIALEPSSHKGMPFPRFKGKTGRVIGKRGKSYIIEIVDGNEVKTIISRPEHLKAI